MPHAPEPQARTSLPVPTRDEDEAIDAGIAADPDAREWTQDDVAQARPAADVLSAAVLEAFSGARRRGRPATANPKVKVMLRIDPEVVEAFRSAGPGWQTRMNAALRKAAGI